MTSLISLLTLILLLGQAPPPTTHSAAIARARALYDNAAYEEALSVLMVLEDDSEHPELEQYRALCLLALNRTTEAERALEYLVVRDPLFQMDVGEVSPRLVLLYRDVRHRMVPLVARSLYAQGKSAFDAGRHEVAASHLQALVALLSTGDPATLSEGLPELRQLAEGFLALTNTSRTPQPAAAITAASPPPPESAAPLVRPLTGTPRTDLSPGRTYSIDDRGVVAPVEIVRRVPTGVELGPDASPRLYQGLIEVVIDEHGRVRTADIRRTISPRFDTALLAATATWRFQPATVDGIAVPYRKAFEIIVWGMSSRQAFGTK